MTQRIRWRVAAALMLAFFMAGGCGTGGSSTKSPPTQTQTPAQTPPTKQAAPAVLEQLIVAQGVDIDTLDPTAEYGTPTFSILDHIFETLVTVDLNMKFIPRLAESWKRITDTTWEFKIRQGVKFHNGEPLNAEAVAFSMERYLDAKRPNYKVHSTMQPIEKAVAIDTYTVHITTKAPYPLLLGALRNRPFIVPPKYVQEKGWEELAKNPIGTGPFKFSKWVPDDRLTVAANPDHWGLKPGVQTIIFRPIPEASTRVAELLAGTVDVIRDVPPDLVEKISTSKRARVETSETSRLLYLQFWPKSDTHPLRNPKVREAINLAIDRDRLVKDVLGGLGKPAASLVNPHEFGYDPNVKGFTYNPTRAKELLREAGFGSGLTLSMVSPPEGYVKVREVVEALVGQFAEVGINVKLNFREWNLYRSQISKKEGPPEELALEGGSNPRYDSGTRIQQMLHSNGASSSLWATPETDKQINLLIGTIDEPTRISVASDLQKRLIEVMPAAPLYVQAGIWGVSNRVDWKPYGDDWFRTYQAKPRPEN